MNACLEASADSAIFLQFARTISGPAEFSVSFISISALQISFFAPSRSDNEAQPAWQGLPVDGVLKLRGHSTRSFLRLRNRQCKMLRWQ